VIHLIVEFCLVSRYSGNYTLKAGDSHLEAFGSINLSYSAISYILVKFSYKRTFRIMERL
jgi:hypothetical protein